MLLKKVVVSLSSVAFALNISPIFLFATNNTEHNAQEDIIFAETTEKNSNGEFSMFSTFSKSYYENIIRCSENIRDDAKMAFKALDKIEKAVNENRGGDSIISDDLKDGFRDFLDKQNKLDDSTRELLKILGLFSDNNTEEDASKPKDSNPEELTKN